MGDRGNIVVLQDGATPEAPDQVWFYSHWGGTDLPETLKTALARQERWQDDSYLARIIFCEMIKGSESGETGLGISTRITDNENDILVCDVPNQRVYSIREDQLKDGRVPDGWKPKESQSFQGFATGKPKEASVA